MDHRVDPGASEESPAEEGGERDAEHDRHEHGRDGVDEALDGRARALRLLDERSHASQDRLLTDRPRLHDDDAVLVERASDNHVARTALDWDRFARHQRFVDGAEARPYHAVDGDPLPRPHPEGIAHR